MKHSVAWVTGGAGGIGSALCRRLAEEGCRVVVGYHNRREEAEKLAQDIGGFPLFCDVTDRASVQLAVDNVLEKFCQLDILLCNAGVAWTGLTQEMPQEALRQVLGVNLEGAFYCCQGVLPPMIGAKQGKIILISSMWGQVGASCEVAYSAAKAGVIGLTRALAQEVGPSGIQVNCVAPGFIATEMNAHLQPQEVADFAAQTPLGRIGTPAEVAEVVAFLASDAASYLTGQVLGVNGGYVL